jgi:hypothetical protein
MLVESAAAKPVDVYPRRGAGMGGARKVELKYQN